MNINNDILGPIREYYNNIGIISRTIDNSDDWISCLQSLDSKKVVKIINYGESRKDSIIGLNRKIKQAIKLLEKIPLPLKPDSKSEIIEWSKKRPKDIKRVYNWRNHLKSFDTFLYRETGLFVEDTEDNTYLLKIIFNDMQSYNILISESNDINTILDNVEQKIRYIQKKLSESIVSEKALREMDFFDSL